MKTIIIGIGNPLLGDDGVGVHVAQLLQTRIQNPSITVDEAFTGGMNLLDLIKGYEKAILIDTIQRKNQKIGTVARYDLSDLPTIHSHNPHDTSLVEAISLAKNLGDDQIPEQIIIYGIAIHHPCTEFTEEMSPSIQEAIPNIINMIISDIESSDNNKIEKR
ncbi:hydrogenase maturation protease [Pseudomonadota bacterium]